MIMINRVRNRKLKEIAKSTMNSLTGCTHVIYGLCYVTPGGNIVEEVADNSSEMNYFYDETSFHECIDAIHTKYEDYGCKHLNIYAVHRNEL